MHCYHGVSRSATFIIAYVMNKEKIGYEAGKTVVRSKRSCIGPNKAFV